MAKDLEISFTSALLGDAVPNDRTAQKVPPQNLSDGFDRERRSRPVSIARTVADTTSLERDRREMGVEWHTAMITQAGHVLRTSPQWAPVKYDGTYISPHREEKESTVLSDNVSNFESLEILTAFFEDKVRNSLEHAAIHTALQVLETASIAIVAGKASAISDDKPTFYSNGGYERPADVSSLLPSSGSAEQLLEVMRSTSYTGTGSSSLSVPSDQSGLLDPSCLALTTGRNVPEYNADNRIDFTTQESLPPLDVSSRSTPKPFREVDRRPPQHRLQDLLAFVTLISGQELDYDGLPSQGVLSLITSDAEEVVALSIETQNDDEIPRKAKGNHKAQK